MGLFYPPDEFQLAQIDYTFQTLTNFALLLGVVVYFFLKNDYSFLFSSLGKPLMALILAGCVGSLIFSVDKMQSIKFMVAVMAISLPSILYLRETGPETVLKSLGIFICAAALLNLAYVILMPQYGIMVGHHDGRWRGLFEHKNFSGPFFAVSFFILMTRLNLKKPIETLVYVLAMLVCIAFVIKAQSATAVMTFVVMGFSLLAMNFIFRLRSSAERVALFAIISSAALALYVVAGAQIIDGFFSLIGKDSTLTGRTGIWKVMFDLINDRPFLGWGPGMSSRPEFMSRIQGDVGWDAKSTHNSYIDLFVNFGYPVAILLILLILKIWLPSFMRNVYSRSQLSYKTIASSLIVVVLIISFANASALFSRSIFSLFLVMGLAILSYINNTPDTKDV